MKTIGIWGLELIKKFEACDLKAYPNEFGSYYIGYGHLESDRNRVISEKMADKILVEDCQVYADYIDGLDLYINAYQRDALIAFGFDCKMSALKSVCKESTHEAMGNALLKYTKSLDKRKPEDLYKRRQAERDLFFTVAHVK